MLRLFLGIKCARAHIHTLLPSDAPQATPRSFWGVRCATRGRATPHQIHTTLQLPWATTLPGCLAIRSGPKSRASASSPSSSSSSSSSSAHIPGSCGSSQSINSRGDRPPLQHCSSARLHASRSHRHEWQHPCAIEAVFVCVGCCVFLTR